MRIFIIRSLGRTAFELGQHCKDTFLKLGHSADIFTYNNQRFSSRIPFLSRQENVFTERALHKKISDFSPQFMLVIKGEKISREIIERIRERFKIPIANYWIDDPFSIDASKTISPFYDYFFTNDPDCVRVHEQCGCPHVLFLSFGCMPKLHRKLKLTKEDCRKYGSEICFAGTVYDERLKVLESLSDFNLKIWSKRIIYRAKEGMMQAEKLSPSSVLYNKFTGRPVWGEELVKVYNASKVVLNIHFPQPVPIMRDFEVTGCGALLLTDNARNLEQMFEAGREVVCYKGKEELIAAVQYYLSHPAEREKIAKAGQERAYKDHTYAVRMKELINFTQGTKQ